MTDTLIINPREYEAATIPINRGRWRLTLHARQFTDASWTTTTIAELDGARSRRLEMALNTPGKITFTMDGRAPQTALIREMAHDVIAWRWDDSAGKDVPYCRAIVAHSEDEISEQSHIVNFTCYDYLSLLSRRWLAAGRLMTQRDQDFIVQDFVTAAVNVTTAAGGQTFHPADYLPLVVELCDPNGADRPASGTLRDRNYPRGSNIGDLLDQLAKVIGGFDYDCVPGWRFGNAQGYDRLRVFFPQQGVERLDTILEYGSSVRSLTRNVNSGLYANFNQVIGQSDDQDVPPPIGEAWNADSNDVTRVPFGLWHQLDNAADVKLQATLTQMAQGNLALDGLLVPQYSAQLRGDFYTEGAFYVGDTVPFYVNSGRLNVTDTVRIMGLNFAIGDDGDEDVELVLGRPRTSLVDLFRLQAADVNALVRR